MDDDINLSKVLAHQLRRHDYDVFTAPDGKKGLEIFHQKKPEVVLSDIQMPGLSGIDVLRAVRKESSDTIIILITAYGSVENAVEACRLGADDYITKPFGQEQLLFVMEKALQLRRLQQENSRLRLELQSRYTFGNMIAHSTAMEEVLRMAGRVAASDASVLLLGESGTGKELLARAIHFNSPRKEQPFITVNSPAIPDNLIESELFGHVKGAFTGALRDRAGKFELADKGTIFLDEIGDLQESVQAKLLRVLQEMEFERLGESRPIKVDVRVIAATNQDLQKLMAENRFREDLYYRLSVVPLQIPPLRKRRQDIPYLAEHFLKKYGGDAPKPLSGKALEILENYSWPGNVRELENIIERALVLTEGNEIGPESLPQHLQQPRHTSPADSADAGVLQPLPELEKQAIRAALKESGGNQSRAARLLKIPRHVLLYKMKKLEMD
ncbi:MAG: sigma-54 dependent transcriptional regulator [Calditrichia bacterium]